VREVVLISQETTCYGEDLGLEHGLARLLREMARIEGLKWIRFLYCYPSQIDEALLRVLREEEKVCRYIDMPLQHVSGRILKSMKRGGNPDSLRRLLDKIRAEVPGVTLRTSLIVGYPGETEAEFQQLCRFVEEVQFDRLGAFSYSDEEGTASFGLGEKIGSRTIRQRERELMKIQKRISRRKNRTLVKQRLPLLVEGPSEETELLWQGRLESQAPRIDGVVLINDLEGPPPQGGDFRVVEIVKSLDYDLVGKIVDV
jgi:ribosomal protein S12 methylthiotransferase